MMIRINDLIDDNVPPYVSLHSTGEFGKDDVILETFIRNNLGSHLDLHKTVRSWIAYRIAFHEFTGTIPPEERGLYNLALKDLVEMHRRRLKKFFE